MKDLATQVVVEKYLYSDVRLLAVFDSLVKDIRSHHTKNIMTNYMQSSAVMMIISWPAGR